MDIIIFLDAAMSPYRSHCSVSIGEREFGSDSRRLRYEKHENNADVPKYKAPNRYFHHVLR